MKGKGTGKRPRIGITLEESAKGNRRTNFLDLAYGRAVAGAGGMPIHFPSIPSEEIIAEALGMIDGLVLTGGADIPPSFYGEETAAPVFPGPAERAEFDIRFFRAALGAGIPILAICHGMQIANVALGGTLYQDLPSQLPGAIPHRGKETRAPAFHTVRLYKGSRLAEVMEGLPEFEVPSLHHQAVKALGTGLRISAEAPDGVIEGIELPDHPQLLSVQWHPEEDPASEASRRLLQALIRMAS